MLNLTLKLYTVVLWGDGKTFPKNSWLSEMTLVMWREEMNHLKTNTALLQRRTGECFSQPAVHGMHL